MPPEPLSYPRARAGARLALAAVYAGIGVVHVTWPDAFLPIMPDWVPYPRDVVLATGVCELMGSVALMTPRLRRAAGWAFAAYAVCVFPANIKHAIENVSVPPIPSSWWYHGPRLAFQPVFVWWALWGLVWWIGRSEARLCPSPSERLVGEPHQAPPATTMGASWMARLRRIGFPCSRSADLLFHAPVA